MHSSLEILSAYIKTHLKASCCTQPEKNHLVFQIVFQIPHPKYLQIYIPIFTLQSSLCCFESNLDPNNPSCLLISRCDDNTYGVNCQDVCDCDNAGTALCSHVDGNCFCNANYFGDKCQMFCPFGYDKMNGCLKSLEVNMYYEFKNKMTFIQMILN